MYGKLVLPKTSVPLDVSILNDIQSIYLKNLSRNTDYLLSFFQVVNGLSISIIKVEPLTIFVSAGRIYVHIEEQGYVLDIPSRTIVLKQGVDNYLIGVSIELYEEDNFKNPLQGGNVLGSLGAKRLVYKTQLVINDDSFSIGLITKDLEVRHINSKGNLTLHRNITNPPLPFLDRYKKDIGNYVSRGFSISQTQDSFIISPGVAYISGQRINISRATILDKPIGNKSFDIGINTNGEIVISPLSNIYEYPEGSSILTEEGEDIYVIREEDEVVTNIYIHEGNIIPPSLPLPLVMNLYEIKKREIEEYPVFIPSNSDIKNIQQELLDIERRTADVINRLNLITGTSSLNVSKYLVISSFNISNSDINYPGYSAHTDNTGLNSSTSLLSIDIPFLDARDNLYPYYLAGELITAYPIWYELSNIEPPAISTYISASVSPTYIILFEQFKYLLLAINPDGGIAIDKEGDIADNPLIGNTTDNRIYTGNLIALVGSRPNKLNVNNQAYTQGLNLLLGRGTISQLINLSNPILTNRVYISINSPSLLLITGDYLGNPDLTNLRGWGYSLSSNNYIELNRPLSISGKVHVLLIPTSNIPITNSLSIATELSKTYMGSNSWVSNTHYLPIRFNEINYRQVENKVPLTISSNNQFNQIRFNLKGIKTLSYTYQSGLQSGSSSSSYLSLSTYTQSTNIELSLAKGDYIDVLGSYIDLGYINRTFNWISVNYFVEKPYSGIQVFIDAEVTLSFSSNYGQAWTLIPQLYSGVYYIEDLSNTVPYEGVTDTTTLIRNNLKLRIQSNTLDKPITTIQVKLIR